MISNKMQIAIRQITQLSEQAKTVADRLNRSIGGDGGLATIPGQVVANARPGIIFNSLSSDMETVKALQDQIRHLNELVEQLKDILEDEAEAVFTDEQAYVFSEGLAVSLKELPAMTIRTVYDRSYFANYAKNLRVLIANALVNHFSTLKLEPMPLWHTLIANNGSMK